MIGLCQRKTTNIVVQINGKKRAILNAKKGIEERELLENIKEDKIVKKYLDEKQINKIIYIKNRLINILVND